MISPELVFVQLSQLDGYVETVELSMQLEASVAEVRQILRDFGDLVECNDNDEWRVIRNIAPDRILSIEERTERDALERTIEQSFVVLGNALKILRDKRLYRETHASFEAYVRDRFGYSRRAADYLIGASEVVENLKREQIVLGTNVLPTKESQCRSLIGQPLETQCKVWTRALELVENKKVPSAKVVKQAVKEITQNNAQQNLGFEVKVSADPSFREVAYKTGTGIEYAVKLDEETFYRLKAYQDRIGSATKCGAIARLLDGFESK